MITSENGARMAGFTRELIGEANNACIELHLLVKEDADLDGLIKLVNGWNFTFTTIQEYA